MSEDLGLTYCALTIHLDDLLSKLNLKDPLESHNKHACVSSAWAGKAGAPLPCNTSALEEQSHSSAVLYVIFIILGILATKKYRSFSSNPHPHSYVASSTSQRYPQFSAFLSLEKNIDFWKRL